MTELEQLIDCLRYRPVATTAAQMREAADRLEQLHEALTIAWREIVASGNERAKDYDWPKVRGAVFKALEIKDER